ncbi:hypothetical protein EWF95_11325 [Halonotius roseus]|uniref:DUF4203 domain-containing protein n=2 Tax=Halonotius roseus TaxID=2511997 RepID=A0A544QLW4_9EURY|nr:hypothetical protein EWF95_11325 [Halonotius roseus]
MIGIDPLTATILGTVTLVGLLLAVAGYNLADTILNVIGWIGGGAAGGAIGWIGLPRLISNGGFETSQILAITAVLTAVGALLGAGLIRMATRYAAGIAGFTAGVAAVFFTLLGREIEATPREVASTGIESSPLAALDLFRFAALPQEELIRILGIAAVVGIVAGIVAMRNYDVLMSICLTGLGAALLANTAPIWMQVIQGNTVSFAADGGFSVPVAVLAFSVGLSVQYLRQRESSS